MARPGDRPVRSGVLLYTDLQRVLMNWDLGDIPSKVVTALERDVDTLARRDHALGVPSDKLVDRLWEDLVEGAPAMARDEEDVVHAARLAYAGVAIDSIVRLWALGDPWWARVRALVGNYAATAA